MSLTIGSLFSGIGGLELGLELAGLGPVLWQVEMNPDCRSVLAKHWPNVTRYEDVTRPRDYPDVDLICGGFPCQDVSSLGAGRGLGGQRSGLWFHFARIVETVAPAWVVVENVSSGLSRWLPHVRHHLHMLGYRTRALGVGAGDLGAPHVRRRIFVVADGSDSRSVGKRARARRLRKPAHDGSQGSPPDARGLSRSVEQETGSRLAGSWNGGRDGRAPVSPVRGVDDGVPGQLDAGTRKRLLGNAVVPACAAIAGRVIMATLSSSKDVKP